MALGQELKEARMRMDLTSSEVASATRMKVQIVDAIEADDYSVFAAPIYGKGFIRLYAEYVGLDPRPLVEEFTESFTAGASPRPKPKMRAREKTPEPAVPDSEPEPSPEPDAPESPAPTAEPRKPKRSPGKARPGRQFDLFNDLPEDEPYEASTEALPSAPAEPDPLVLPLKPDPEPEPDSEPVETTAAPVGGVDEVFVDPSEQSPEPVLPEPEPNFVPESEPELDSKAEPEPEPEPEPVSVETRAADNADDFEDPQDILSPSLRERVERLFKGSGENGEREGLQIPHLVISGVGVIIILAFIISGISKCARGPGENGSGDAASGLGNEMVLGIDMPEPYFD